MLYRGVSEEEKRARRELRLEIPEEVILQERKALLREYRKRTRVPGFRKGQAPDHVLESLLKEELDEESFERALKRVLKERLEDQHLEPISRIKIEETEERDGVHEVRVSFEVLPDFDFPDLSKLSFEKRVEPVKEQEVQEVLERERHRHAQLVPVERAAENGDYLRVDYWEKTPSGKKTLKRKKNVLIHLNQELPEALREALVGVKAGDTVETALEDRSYRIRVHQVLAVELPEMDDEFAKTLGYENLAELEEKVRESLRRSKEEDAERRLEAEIVHSLYEAIRFDLPESMVMDALEDIKEQILGDAEAPLDEGMEQEFRRMAEERVARDVLLSRAADHLNIQVEDEEVQEEAVKLAIRSGYDPQKFLAYLYRSGAIHELEERIRRRKAMAYLKKQVKVEVIVG